MPDEKPPIGTMSIQSGIDRYRAQGSLQLERGIFWDTAYGKTEEEAREKLVKNFISKAKDVGMDIPMVFK